MIDFESYKNLLKSDRSVRRFDESVKVGEETLLRLVDLTRFCASGRNAQPLKYRLVSTTEECAKVFPSLAWAGYYKDWDGPEEGERPTAYLVQCIDTRILKECLCDDGLQLQAITLGIKTLGLSACIIKAFNAQKVSEALGLPEYAKPRYVLAIGKGVEKVELESMTPGMSFEYHRDADGTQVVPKRTLEELIIR